MLDINLIRQNPEKVRKGVVSKNGDPKLVDKFLRLDEKWRNKTAALDQLKAEQNVLSKELAKTKSEVQIARAQLLKKRITELTQELSDLEKRRTEIILQLPNLPLEETPVGKDETENKILREVGEKPEFDFKPKDYLALSEKLDLIDIKTAAEVSGTRFGYLKREAAILEFALIEYAMRALTNESELSKIAKRFGLKKISAKPFVPVVPPVMIKPDVLRKMARLDPRQEEERYYIPKDNLYLVGSAEHTLGSMHINQIFLEQDLPLRYVGFSTCFRREAGSYGKDTKGILRVHQFDKIEMESFCLPEVSGEELDFIVACQEYLMQGLEIPYRVIDICAGDMGSPDARQIDLEAWLPGQGIYRETHTADFMTDYQARRLGTKVKINSKTEFVHMIDATVLAIGRTIIAIIENFQTKDGKIRVPKVLQPYLGKKEIWRSTE